MGSSKITTRKSGVGVAEVMTRFYRNVQALPIVTADNIVFVAQEMCPVWEGRVNPGVHGHAHSYPIPGALRDSIHRVGNEVRVEAYYGIYVEFGTRFMHAEPFLTPATRAVGRTQFRHDVDNLFREDLYAGTSIMLRATATTIVNRQHKHAATRRRNKRTSHAVKGAEAAALLRRYPNIRKSFVPHGAPRRRP